MSAFRYESALKAPGEILASWLSAPAARRRLDRLALALPRSWRRRLAASPPAIDIAAGEDGNQHLIESLAEGSRGEGRQFSRLRGYFRSRHRRLAGDLAWAELGVSRPGGRVAMTGASGLVGRELGDCLEAAGWKVLRLVRREARNPRELAWDPERGPAEPAALEGLDAFIHLAGANVGQGRWTPARKALIRSSRVETTRRLAQALAGLKRPPGLLVSASATGIYGHRGDEALTEDSAPGKGWLADLARDWEEAAQPASQAGIRVLQPRIGMVISGAGGALPRLLTPFRLGLGGPLGQGKQFWSWIALDDLLGLIRRALKDEDLSGPINAVSPHPANSRSFAHCLAQVLKRPAVLPLPAIALRLAMGEAAGPLILDSARVLPKRLLDLGFDWRAPELDLALRAELLALDVPLPFERCSVLPG